VKRLIVASTNPGKVREVQLSLAGLIDWQIETLPQNLSEAEENGSTFIENAIAKAMHYSRYVRGFTLADDSGLAVDALEGQPGIHSDRYGPSAEARNTRLLNELRMAGSANRGATFYCALAVALGGDVIWTIQTELRGRIAQTPAGDWGFGYDPLFVVPEARKTLAQMTPEEKNRVSARGRALKQLNDFLTHL
jgi:XTP/dITP diphosphohydrolase